MRLDRLDALLRRFSVSAQMFHSGPLCGIRDIPASPAVGQLHVVKRGPVRVHHGGRVRQRIEQPSLLFYPRPLHHRLMADARTGADLACANVVFSGGSVNPIAQALPAVVVMPLAELQDAQPVLDLLFREAFGAACGRQHVVDRLLEVLLVQILRTLMDHASLGQGLLAGMADPRLAKALTAIHEAPGRDWPLQRLAARAGMSRSHFVAVFQTTVGSTPGDYLARFRMCVAQDLLRSGATLKQVAGEVGYGSPAALSRAFSAICGRSPRQWKAALGHLPGLAAQPGHG